MTAEQPKEDKSKIHLTIPRVFVWATLAVFLASLWSGLIAYSLGSRATSTVTTTITSTVTTSTLITTGPLQSGFDINTLLLMMGMVALTAIVVFRR